MAEYIKQEMNDLHGTGEKKVYYPSYTLLYIASSGFLEGVFSQSIEKKRVKTLVKTKKMRTFAGRLLSD